MNVRALRRGGRSAARTVTSVVAALGMVASGLVLLAPAASAAPDTYVDPVQNVKYSYDPANISVGATAVAYLGVASVVGIPDYISPAGQQIKVTEIGYAAFQSRGLTHVTIGDNVTKISNEAFQDNQLTSVELGENLEHISNGAFRNNLLTSVAFGDKVSVIRQDSFRDNKLTDVTFGSGLTWIGQRAFYANQLTSVDLPESLENIDYLAFGGNKLTAVRVPPQAELDGFAFYNNELTSIQLPQALSTIPFQVFRNNNLTSVVIPPTVTEIGFGAFEGNPDLTSVAFTGPAPTVEPADSVPTSGTTTESFDTDSGNLVLTYPWRFGASARSGGYTTPTWHGYQTQAIATVKFDNQGRGSTPPPVDIAVGKKIAAPPAPSVSGYSFTGWYTDKGASNKWNFAAKTVTRDVTLYAGWKSTSPDTKPPTPPRQGPCQPFPDVNASNMHCRNIEWLAGMNITAPIGGKYMPGNAVTRGSMATFLYRLDHPGKAIPKCVTKPFRDVDVDYVHCGAIAWAVKNRITVGYGDGTYRPLNPVTRGSMATFLYRIAGSPATPMCGADPFDDVSSGYVHCKTIRWAKTNKITSGLAGGHDYGPERVVNRDQMASFLHRIYDFMH